MKSKSFRTICVSFILVICILMTTGCIWLRLLTVQKQLAEFDKFVKISTTNGLSLTFVKPVLYEDDILFLNGKPTVEHVNGINKNAIYTFRKVNPTNAVDNLTNAPLPYVDIPIQFDYENKMFCCVTFPDSLVKCLPENFIVDSCRSLGHAEVDTAKRSVDNAMVSSSTNLPIPIYKQLTSLLGVPTEIKNHDGKEQLSYWFELLPPESVTQQKNKYYYLFRYDFIDKEQMTGLFNYYPFRYNFIDRYDFIDKKQWIGLSIQNGMNSLKLNK